MGKKRNTAKTGDKGLYKKAAEAAAKARNAANNNNSSNKKSSGSSYHKNDDNDDDSNMYDDVDKYQNEKDRNFIKFDHDSDGGGDDDDDGSEQEEAVMDLGIGGDSSSQEDDGDDSDCDDDDDGRRGKDAAETNQLGSSSSSSDDDDDEEELEDVRDWGKKKSAYYHGDTADLELGQDEEDAFLEEEAAKEVQAARYEEMEEKDFLLSDDDDEAEDKTQKSKTASPANDKEQSASSRLASLRDISKLTSKDRRKLLEKQHPGLLQILSHFSKVVRDLEERTSVATNALFGGEEDDDATAEAVGATKLGKQYLLTKALIQSSMALNLATFLLLKSEESSNYDDKDNLLMGPPTSSLVQFHPVMKRLQELNVLSKKLEEKVEDKVEGLNEQLENLIKASKLMESLAVNADGDEAKSESNSDDGSSDAGANQDDNAEVVDTDKVIADEEGSSSSDGESLVDEESMARTAMQNARFGLRPNEIAQDKSAGSKRRRRAVPSDLGDDGNAQADNKGAARYLSSALNTIKQRAASRKKKRISGSEELVEQKEPDDDLRRGLEMMEAELGKASDEEECEVDPGGDGDEIDEGGFYSTMTKKSKAKKAFKKSLHKVAPKYPRLEGEVEGERAVSRTIMKNRGLVPHKNKLNRNPRVKKREQYRKALIKRKGTVREVRTDEGHKYGGEETGIKRGISRSRKLATK